MSSAEIARRVVKVNDPKPTMRLKRDQQFNNIPSTPPSPHPIRHPLTVGKSDIFRGMYFSALEHMFRVFIRIASLPHKIA